MENNFPTALTAQSTHKDLVRKCSYVRVNIIINELMDWLKEQDSELCFVKNELDTISIGQSTH